MKATISTNHGDINIELFPNHAPKTVANFAQLASGEKEWTHPETGEVTTNPLYDGVIFHRVIRGFMIQGGDPIGRGTGGPGYTFDDEIHGDLNFQQPYVLAMANAGTRRGLSALGTPVNKGTNGSQFFITVAPTPHLQGKHTIFGKVADDASKAVVDSIATTPTGAGDKPVTDVVIKTITIEK